MSNRSRTPVVPVLAVSSGAGQARQFRVQFQNGTDTGWKRYATFDAHLLAEQCACQLAEQGVTARVIPFRIVPAAG